MYENPYFSWRQPPNAMSYPYQQSPVQNFINTGLKPELEAKFIGDNEDIANIVVSSRTVFIDEKKGIMAIKEADGTISKKYQLIIPKDEKDIEIDNLKYQLNQSTMYNQQIQKRLEELEGKLNVGYEPNKTDNASSESCGGDNIDDTRPSKKTGGKGFF